MPVRTLHSSTPLTNLHGYLEGLREGVVAPEAQIFASLQDEVARLRRLSDSLDPLAAGVDTEQSPEELGLVPLMNAHLDLRRPRLRHGAITLQLELAARPAGTS